MIYRTLIFSTTLLSCSAFAQDMITINLSGTYIFSGDVHVIEVIDLNCNVYKGRFSLTENQIIPISICRVGAGHWYGRIKLSSPYSSGWTELSSLSDGDEVTP
jgi:hypothetical protein